MIPLFMSEYDIARNVQFVQYVRQKHQTYENVYAFRAGHFVKARSQACTFISSDQSVTGRAGGSRETLKFLNRRLAGKLLV